MDTDQISEQNDLLSRADLERGGSEARTFNLHNWQRAQRRHRNQLDAQHAKSVMLTLWRPNFPFWLVLSFKKERSDIRGLIGEDTLADGISHHAASTHECNSELKSNDRLAFIWM